MKESNAYPGGTVLLVEDDTLLLEILGMELKQRGHYVLDARDGVEALTVMATFRPDLIVTDLMMPHMNGFEFISTVRRTHRHIPIIAMSASVSYRDKQLAYERGADEFMRKPFAISHLEGSVEKFLSLRSGGEKAVPTGSESVH